MMNTTQKKEEITIENAVQKVTEAGIQTGEGDGPESGRGAQEIDLILEVVVGVGAEAAKETGFGRFFCLWSIF